MADERQMVVFEANEQAKVTKMIREIQRDDTLTAFSNISDIIKKATGMLPTDVIPIVQQLCDSYSKTTIVIKVGFADTCALLTKFLIKSYRVMQRGMNEKDEKVLMGIEKQLNTDIITQLEEFVESSRSELVEIQKQLLLKASGDKLTNLLNERDTLEADLLRRSMELANKASECGANQGKIDSLLYEKQMFEKAVTDSVGSKEETMQEIRNLKGQITFYENQVQQHRDTHTEERQHFWWFSWKVRDVHQDNGERLARENLNRLLQRIRDLEGIVNNWSNIDLIKRVTDVKAELGNCEVKKSSLESEHTLLKKLCDQVEKRFYATIEEMEEIYRNSGTRDHNSLIVVGELCVAVQSGQESIVSAYGKLRTHLRAIDIDEDLLVSSMLDALQLMNMADAYMGVTSVQNVRQVLALE
ncbi:unnamed protein product [Rotaria sp. Silwood1]|nr:unnamed protein product [Rotaria sp. Silwood1]CAF3882887.1 unnamed protein product [Rotaria sp. Silwood1]CAF3884554.1 unnamed protein product [Rotaria sp. Silwood1]CAF3972848.1 unnamed protein product [Rotaria sp. Silwood1]CAF4914710.1 unnamed protein product [Rotaria sp. Silwood1]